MTFDWTISFGNVLQMVVIAGAIISVYVAAVSKLKSLEDAIKYHASMLTAHSARLDKVENGFIDVVSNLQRWIGRVEAGWAPHDRTGPPAA